jgi:hypothetical protein
MRAWTGWNRNVPSRPYAGPVLRSDPFLRRRSPCSVLVVMSFPEPIGTRVPPSASLWGRRLQDCVLQGFGRPGEGIMR